MCPPKEYQYHTVAQLPPPPRPPRVGIPLFADMVPPFDPWEKSNYLRRVQKEKIFVRLSSINLSYTSPRRSVTLATIAQEKGFVLDLKRK